MQTPQEFASTLREMFFDKKPFFLNTQQTDCVFDTIKAYLQKKQLVVVSRVEYEKFLANQTK